MKQTVLPQAAMTAMGSEKVLARVVDIVEEGDIDLGGVVQRYQIARVELLEENTKARLLRSIMASDKSYRMSSICSAMIRST
ncbi:MAG: hypothetical protein QM730_16525 [Anaerolineales bacterium]